MTSPGSASSSGTTTPSGRLSRRVAERWSTRPVTGSSWRSILRGARSIALGRSRPRWPSVAGPRRSCRPSGSGCTRPKPIGAPATTAASVSTSRPRRGTRRWWRDRGHDRDDRRRRRRPGHGHARGDRQGCQRSGACRVGVVELTPDLPDGARLRRLDDERSHDDRDRRDPRHARRGVRRRRG